MTVNGYTCQKWTEQLPYEHIYTMDKFNEKGIGDHNYCRNPDGEDESGTELEAWCYTTSLTKHWDWCEVPTCHSAGIDFEFSSTLAPNCLLCPVA